MSQKLRDVQYDSFDELRDDVLALRERGYERGGSWDLPMIEDHLARSIVAPLDGAGPKLFPPLTWVARWVIRRMARQNRYPSVKFPAPAFMQPSKDVSAAHADAAFDAAIERAKSVAGPAVQTRPFGKIPLADWRAMQLIHAAHHLSHLQAH